MSEENHEGEITANANGNSEDLVATIEQLKSTNERLLAESQRNKSQKNELKSECETMKDQLENYKKRELEEKGNYQEMLQMEKEKSLTYKQQLQAYEDKLLRSNVMNAVSNAAKDAYDVNDLLAQKDYAKMIEIPDGELEPTKESIQSFVNSLKEDKKYLFKGNTVKSMADTKPAIEKPTNKTVAQMNAAERKEYMMQQLSSIPTN